MYRYTGVDTLDEPVSKTIVSWLYVWGSLDVDKKDLQARDLLSIYTKLVQVLYPRRSGAGREVLR